MKAIHPTILVGIFTEAIVKEIAAHSLVGIVDTTKPGASVLPPVSKLTKFSETVAIAVAAETVRAGLNRLPAEAPAKCVKEHKCIQFTERFNCTLRE